MNAVALKEAHRSRIHYLAFVEPQSLLDLREDDVRKDIGHGLVSVALSQLLTSRRLSPSVA